LRAISGAARAATNDARGRARGHREQQEQPCPRPNPEPADEAERIHGQEPTQPGARSPRCQRGAGRIWPVGRTRLDPGDWSALGRKWLFHAMVHGRPLRPVRDRCPDHGQRAGRCVGGSGAPPRSRAASRAQRCSPSRSGRRQELASTILRISRVSSAIHPRPGTSATVRPPERALPGRQSGEISRIWCAPGPRVPRPLNRRTARW